MSLTNVCSRFVVSPVRLVPLGAFIRSGYSALFERVFLVTSLFWPTIPKCVTNSSQTKAQASSVFSEFEHNLWSTVLDVVGEFYMGPMVLSYLVDFEAARIGLTSRFALDIVSL